MALKPDQINRLDWLDIKGLHYSMTTQQNIYMPNIPYLVWIEVKGLRPTVHGPHVSLVAHLCGSTSNFQNVHFIFSCWLWRSTISTAVFRRFEVPICHILNFYKKHMLSSERLVDLITHTQQVMSLFGIAYCYEQLFFKMKYAKSTLHLSNHLLSDVFLLSTSSFNSDTSFCDCKQHPMSHE